MEKLAKLDAEIQAVEKELAEKQQQKERHDEVVTSVGKITETLEGLPKKSFTVEVANPQDFPKEIKVENLGEIVIPDTVTVDNLDEIEIPEFPKEIEVAKPNWFSLKGITDGIKEIVKAIEKKAFTVDLKEYAKKRNAIAVKLVNVDGTSFYNAFGGGGSGAGTPNAVQTVNINNLPSVYPINDNGGSITVDGSISVSNLPASQSVTIGDGANLDAFSRLRTSQPSYVFDGQFTYNLLPLLFEPITSGSGATVTHDTTNRNALMTFANTATGGKAYMQSYEHFRYQPGRSQEVLLTFNFMGGVADTLKFVGYSDGNNGIELQMNGTTPRLALLSDTAKGDEFVNQADWNIDKLNGLGASGINLNFSKTHIFVIDFQWLGVGRIRCGFDIDGVIVYCHEFTHANIQEVAYMQTASLPLRAGMTCTGTVSTTMRFICCSVISEGGQEDVGGYGFSVEGSGTAGNNAQAHILSVRPTTTYNGLTNRVKFVLESVEIFVTGNTAVKWELVIGQAITQAPAVTYISVNSVSAFEYNTLGTISGSPYIVIASGYVPATASVKGTSSFKANLRYPITLDQAGAVRLNGTISLLATGLGATSTTRAVMNWREIR